MATITTTLQSGQNAYVGVVTSRRPQTITVSTGIPGVSIDTANVNANGYLILTLSNTATINAGSVIGPTGATGSIGPTGANGANGNDGANGANGNDGANGANGADGVGITTASIASGNLIITLTNTSIIDAGTILPTVNIAAQYTWSNVQTFSNTVNFNGDVTATGNISGNTAGFAIGYRDVPQLLSNTNTTLANTDMGKHYYCANTTSMTLTIANNATVTGVPIGAVVSVVSYDTGDVIVARDAGVSLYLAANSTNADRTIGAYGMATIMKVATDTWVISGTGVT